MNISLENIRFKQHKLIVKDKEPVELEEINVEKEPTETIEYVPKEEVKLI